MKVVYLSGPIRAETPRERMQNIEKAQKYAADLWLEGYAVICPHANSLIPLEDNDVPWIEGDIEILKRCDIVFMMPEWTNSKGSRLELEAAEKAGVEIRYLEDKRYP